MIPILVALWTANRKLYGAHKLWKAARRAGHDIGRDQVARLMKTAGIEGVTRRRKVRTTRPDQAGDRHPDLVDRQFTADAPNRLWTVDLTYVPTWAGMAYVCFITDAFSRRIVGWRVAAHMRASMVLDALEMARWTRGTRLEGLVAHSDAGSQAQPLPCLRSSPLAKRYGWGFHFDDEGRVAIHPMESETYEAMRQQDSLTHLKAMRSRRK